MTQASVFPLILGVMVTAGCAAAPLALNVASTAFGTAGFVRLSSQTDDNADEIKELKEEVRRLREALRKQVEGSSVHDGWSREQILAGSHVSPTLQADALSAREDGPVP